MSSDAEQVAIVVAPAESVRERDLDHLLMEEVFASDLFRAWFVGQIPSFQPAEPAAIAAYRAERREGDQRETDLRFDYLDATETRFACLLVEDKVSAGFQPGQAQSYAREITLLRSQLGSQNAAAVLVAPSSYSNRSGVEQFDAMISIESVISRMEDDQRRCEAPELERRLAIKLGLLRRLIGRGGRQRGPSTAEESPGWEPVAVSKKRVFSNRYGELLAERAPGFAVSLSSEGPNARTKIFCDFPGKSDLHVNVTLRHEFGRPQLEARKYANLQFPGKVDRFEALAAHAQLFLSDRSIYLAKAGGALAVRIDTPAIQPDGERFDDERDKVIAGIEAVKRLVVWLSENRAEIQAALT